MSNAPRIRALVLAELCNPEWVSGPLVGWSHAFALSKNADVHLVTHEMNEPAIERSSWPRDRVTFIRLANYEKLKVWFTHRVLRSDHTTQMFTAVGIPFYWLFERLTWQLLGKRIEGGEFDVVHRITPVSPVVSSPITKRLSRARVPFVLGPINGGLPWPKGYANALQKERELVNRFRSVYQHAPFLSATWRDAAALLVASRATWDEIPERHRSRCFYLPENGILETTVSRESRGPLTKPLRAVFVGRLTPYKCADVAIRGLAPAIKRGDVVFDILGHGPERAYLERIVREEGIGAQTTFHGWLEHKDTLRLLGQAHLQVFPSIREFGGGVVVEGMALGVVPIVMAYGGPAEIVDDRTGFRLPLESAEITARQIDRIVSELVAKPDRWLPMSDACRERIRDEFTWEAKAKRSISVYEHVLGRAPRPELSPPPPPSPLLSV